MSKLTKDKAKIAAMSPLQAVTHVVEADDCPAAIQQYVDHALNEILSIQLPRLCHVMRAGPSMPTKNVSRIYELFSEAMAELSAELPRHYSATLIQCGEDIAKLLDKSTRRILLADKLANREAVMELSSLHAKMVRVLASVAFTEEERIEVQRLNREQASALN
jgi:hypothetical protein